MKNCRECARLYLGTCATFEDDTTKCFVQKSDWMTDMLDDDCLRPCPFCGGEADFQSYEEDDWVQCGNKKCGARGSREGTNTEARNKWNQRAYDWLEDENHRLGPNGERLIKVDGGDLRDCNRCFYFSIDCRGIPCIGHHWELAGDCE